MKLHEVPPELLAVQCMACREFLAVDPELTPAEAREVADAHRALCRVRFEGGLVSEPPWPGAPREWYG